jgi:hypothetical protein
MNLKTSLTSQIKRYLLENPVDDSAINKYAKVCREFNTDIKTASKCWNDLKREEGEYLSLLNKIPEANYTEQEIKKILKQDGENLNITINTDIEVKSLEDLMIVCEVDPKKWDVISWQCKKWDLGIKNNVNEIQTKQLFSVSAKFKPVKIDSNLSLQKDFIIDELFKHAPAHRPIKYTVEKGVAKDLLLEIALFDVHFGKLAHAEEVGEDYDLKIASARFTQAVESLLKNVNLNRVAKILFPIGQDLINVDNLQNSTTAGTPQDSDSRFHKIVKTVKTVLINTIDRLSTIAPVDIVITTGNHDEQTTFMIGEMLEAYYHRNPNISVDNGAFLRKYYKYGTVGIMFTHGNREKFNELGMIFAAENPKLWAATTQRYVQIGHFHHNKKITTLQTQEFQGFQVQIIPSLSGTDAYHYGRGYYSQKQAKAFLYSHKDGLVGEFTFTAK